MKMLYDVSDEVIKCVKDGTWCGSPMVEKMIATGIPLPKGHGRLFDERDIINGNYEIIGNRIYELEPIIEADTESEGTNVSSS